MISVISTHHDRNGFDCGSRELNTFLKTIAQQHMKKGISRTFVLTEAEDSPGIIGFYTLCACETVTERMPKQYAKKYPRKIPTAKLARLAVDKNYQGRGYGAILLVDSLKRLVTVSKNLGIVAYFVDAKDDNAASFYQRLGFIPLPDSPYELFLPLPTIEAAFS
jgi:N-acetylglutamate synthase-like GNAT family acetyltransferase